MKSKLIFNLAILLFSSQLYAQRTENVSTRISNKVDYEMAQPTYSTEVIDWEPTTSYFLELLGKGFYSINVDFRKTTTRAISIGGQYTEDGDNDVFWPSLMYYHFSGKRFRFETGGGLSTVFTQTDGLAGMGIHGVIGYRYQKKKGLIFRTGFTPFIGIPFTDTGRFPFSEKHGLLFLPLIGISLGYSF
jgi:hypothetical protein